MADDKDIVESALEATANGAKGIADAVFYSIGAMLGQSSSSKSDDITITENEDGSKTIHIPKK